MKLAHTVSKKMFCSDVSTIMNLLRAKREGNVIVLFPEGRLGASGRTGKLTEGTAALAKKLGMSFEGIHRRAIKCKGEYRDVCVAAITRDEYFG